MDDTTGGCIIKIWKTQAWQATRLALNKSCYTSELNLRIQHMWPMFRNDNDESLCAINTCYMELRTAKMTLPIVRNAKVMQAHALPRQNQRSQGIKGLCTTVCFCLQQEVEHVILVEPCNICEPTLRPVGTGE